MAKLTRIEEINLILDIQGMLEKQAAVKMTIRGIV